MERAIRIGVTGKIGSGKSTLLQMMGERGITVVNSDVLARNLMETDPVLIQSLRSLLGDEAYEEGKLHRPFIASLIFDDPSLRRTVEQIVHPAVTREIEFVFQNSEPGKCVAVESALILQTDFRTHFDYIILVDSPDEASVSRLESTGRFDEREVRSRLAGQKYDDGTIGEAEFWIENSGSLAEFEERCRGFLNLLSVIARRPLPETPLHGTESEE